MNAESVSGSPAKAAPPLSPMGRRMLWVILAPFFPVVLVFLLVLLSIALQIGRVFSVPTNAMSPTIASGDHIYTNMISYRIGHPNRGDVVCFWTDGITQMKKGHGGANTTFVKRVVGLPGETITLHAGQLWVNGRPAPELARFHYEPAPEGIDLTAEDDAFVVPPESYFVLGDNTANSLDSRYWGCVPAANLRGRALFRFWPPSRMGLIN